MLLQAITIDDDLYEAEKGVAQLRQHPRLPRRLPALEADDRRLPRPGDQHARGLDRRHHRPLPADPRAPGASASSSAWERLRPRGYDERFRRLWDFYLCSSEAGFRERRIGDVQLLFAKPGWR